MNALDTTILKDKILQFLAKNPDMYIDIDVIRKDLKMNSISIAVICAYIKEMSDDIVIDGAYTKDGGSARILDMGHKLLVEGGYTRIATEAEENSRKSKEKTKLEIQNLKRTKVISILAIIISLIALAVSIFKN
jgi:hypothetical protein